METETITWRQDVRVDSVMDTGVYISQSLGGNGEFIISYQDFVSKGKTEVEPPGKTSTHVQENSEGREGSEYLKTPGSISVQTEKSLEAAPVQAKTILFYTKFFNSNWDEFLKLRGNLTSCQFQNCIFLQNTSSPENVDAIIFHQADYDPSGMLYICRQSST